MKSKRGQVYIVTALIIIMIIVGFATLSNYTHLKKQPNRFSDISTILEMNGISLIENAVFNDQSINEVIQKYLILFKNYLQTNTYEDFNLVIMYGSLEEEQIVGQVFSRGSLGDITFNLGESSFVAIGGTTINVQEEKIRVEEDPISKEKIVNVEILDNGKTYILGPFRLLDDQNNFIYVMTTSQGFEQYVKTNAVKV